MYEVVKITIRDDGEIVEYERQKWCLVADYGGSSCTFCSQEVFGSGEGSASYKVKESKIGGITCIDCIKKIKEIKKIKL